jgi:hypothetical protein
MPPTDDAAAAEAEAKRFDAELTAQETTNASIHSQAIGVMNIKVLIPVTLEKPANNYGRWKSMSWWSSTSTTSRIMSSPMSPTRLDARGRLWTVVSSRGTTAPSPTTFSSR